MMHTNTFVKDKPQFLIDLKLPRETRLRFSGDYEPVAAWRLLSRYIARYPHDLRVHAQRVFLTLDANLTEYLAGALQDLIIALSGKGKPFFKSLLEQARPALSDSEQRALLTAFDTENLHQCWKQGSVLASGICNAASLVIFKGSDEELTGFANALEEAQAYIEYGELEEARELLENELLTQSDTPGIEEELLYLYQSMREPSYIEAMTVNLQSLNIELSPLWKQCLEEAKSW